MKQILIFIIISYSFSLTICAQNDSISILKREYNELKKNEREYDKLVAKISNCRDKQERLVIKIKTQKKELKNLEFEIRNLNYELRQAKSIDLIKKDIIEANKHIVDLDSNLSLLEKLKEKNYKSKLIIIADSIVNEKSVLKELKKANSFMEYRIDSLKESIYEKENHIVAFRKKEANIENTSNYYAVQNRILMEKVLNNDTILEAIKNTDKQQALYNSFERLCQNSSNFLSSSEYDLQKNTYYLNQIEHYINNFLFLVFKNGEQDYQRIESLYNDLKKNEKIILAINASKKNLLRAYNPKEAQITLSKLEKAIDTNNHTEDLNKYKTLISNYEQKNNEAYKILKTAKSFYSIGQAKDAKQLLNDNKAKFEEYPFLANEFKRLLRNFNYQLKIKKSK